MENLSIAMKLADDTFIFDNSQSKHTLVLLLEKDIIKEIYQQEQPNWLKQRLHEYTLQVGQQLVFRHE
jgi:predicted ABC-type ATPase